jgi:ferric-dicitrate binding protein FerR (iron transport regulator)
MTNPDRASATLDPIKRQALQWLDRLLSSDTADQDADALKRWRMLSAAHARAFAEAVYLRRVLVAAARPRIGGRAHELE